MPGTTHHSLRFVCYATLQQTITTAVLHVLFIDNFPQIKESTGHGGFIVNLYPSKLKPHITKICLHRKNF
jgi:hypothetical protein